MNRLTTIRSGHTTMVVDPLAGGRVVSLRVGAREVLAGKDVHPENYGSTFWPSPQSLWNWPPPAVLDREPYTATEESGGVALVSGSDPVTGLRCVKRVAASTAGRIRLEYTMINAGAKTAAAAPWEITRVRKEGLLFFPLGSGSLRKKQFDPAPARVSDGIVWYQDGPGRPAAHQLSIADGSEGWAAYAVDGVLLVKIFQDTPQEAQAPGEAEVLFYVSAEAGYLEMEVQGRYEKIEPGRESSWRVEWAAETIPGGIAAKAESQELVEFVRSIVRSAQRQSREFIVKKAAIRPERPA